MNQQATLNNSYSAKRLAIRTLNIPFLLGSLVVIGGAALTAFGVHSWQISRTATAFLQRASQYENDSKWFEAAEYINRYLQLSPNDGQESVHLAKTFVKGAETFAQRRRAIDLLYRAIGAGIPEEEPALRKQVGEFLFQNGRYVEAAAEAEKLLGIDNEDAAALRLRALALVRQYQAGALAREESGSIKIIKPLELAHEKNQGDMDLAELLARAYLDEELVKNERPDIDKKSRSELANATLDNLIKVRPNDPQAYLVRYSFRTIQNPADSATGSQGAKDDLEQALKLGPKDVTVLLTAAQAARRESARIVRTGGAGDDSNHQLLRAHDLYQRIVKENLAPENPIPHVALGETLLELGKKDEAIAIWKTGLSTFKKTTGIFHAHLADLWLDMGKLAEVEPSLNAIQAEIDQLPPNTDRQGRMLVERDQFLRQGIWYMKRGEVSLSVPLLQKVVLRQEQLGGDSRQSTRAFLLLGAALSSLGEWNDSALAFDRAALQQPELAAARTAASVSWLAANRPELAVDRAEQGIRLEPSSKGWFTLATACFQQQSLLPSEDRVWGRFEQALSNSFNCIDDGTLDEPWRVDVLQADFFLASTIALNSSGEGQQKAIDVLRRAELKYPQVISLWQSIPLIYQRLGQPSDADRSLERFSTLPNVGIKAALIRARLLLMRGQYDLAEQALQIAGKDDPLQIQRELINVKLARRDFAAAHKMLEQLQRLNPRDLSTLRRLADIDLDNGKLDQVAKWETAMQLSEGTGQILATYFKIRRLILQASSARDPLLEQAAIEQAKLENLRPSWAEAVALRGVIEERRDNLDSAISAYERAISLGEQRVLVFEHLMRLLERSKRSADAEKYLSRLGSHIPLSQGLTEFESTVEIRRNQPEKAVEVARLAVERRPQDPAAHIWLGKMLLVKKQTEEAEKEFQRAVDLQPNDVRCWNGLFSFYLQIGNREKGRATLARLAEKAKLSDEERSFVLAQGYELLGDQSLAIAEYKNAAKLKPKNTAILLRMAGYYLRNSPDEAEAYLEQVLKIDGTSGVARRTLAAFLAARGKDADWARVDELLVPAANQGSSPQDNRLRAILLTRRGGTQNVRLAVEILEELVARQENQVFADRLMLAQLYEKLSRITSDTVDPKNTNGRTPMQYLALCQDQFIALCARPAPQPSHLTAFVEFLLRHEELKSKAGEWLDKFEQLLNAAAQPSPILVAEYVRLRLTQGDKAVAETWQKRLEKSEPDALETIALRTQLMVKQDKKAEVRPFVEAAAKRLLERVKEDKQRAALFKVIGRLYASHEMYADAESWYRKLYGQEPGTFEPLVSVLTQQGRTMEAIQICDEATKTEKSPRSALIAVSVLASGKTAATEAQQAEALISSALKRYPKDVRLLTDVATLRVMQGQTDDAVNLLRRVVDVNPLHVIALNNLATLLSERAGQRKEALRLIDQAIEITGSEAALFDTKGTILLFDDQSEKAIEFLKVAVSSTNSDPRYRFHLALAYQDLHETEKAKDELEQALQKNLDKQLLTPTEQKMLSNLRSILTP